MRYFSMFSGIGGFELGIQQAYEKIRLQRNRGSRPIYRRSEKDLRPHRESTATQEPSCVGFSEIDKYAIQIYQRHFPSHKNYGNATKIDTAKLPDFDLLVGGFPCQAFSIAGKRKGFDDTRGTLFFEIARVLQDKRPRYFLLENVKGLLSHDEGKTFQTILGVLSDLGYELEWQVLNSKNFGVPQNRERIFIVGHLGGTSRPKVFPIRNGNEEYNERTQSVSSAIDANYHKGGASRGFGSKRRQLIQLGIVGKKDNMEQRIYDKNGIATSIRSEGGGQGSKTGLYAMDLYNKKLHSDRTPTLTEPHHNSLRLYEYGRIRRLTPKECERLQGFPDGWTEGVSDTQRYKCLGNAVTVNVVREIIERL